MYEDKSVLENMHCMLIVQLLRKHGFSFLLDEHAKPTTAAPDPPSLQNHRATDDSQDSLHDFRGFKKLVYSAVLATDMSIHFKWIKHFQDFAKRIRAAEYGELTADEMLEGRILLTQAIIKCADISNPVSV